MELLAWELRRPNAVTWGLLIIGPPNYNCDDINTVSFTTLLSAQLAEWLTTQYSCHQGLGGRGASHTDDRGRARGSGAWSGGWRERDGGRGREGEKERDDSAWGVGEKGGGRAGVSERAWAAGDRRSRRCPQGSKSRLHDRERPVGRVRRQPCNRRLSCVAYAISRG